MKSLMESNKTISLKKSIQIFSLSCIVLLIPALMVLGLQQTEAQPAQTKKAINWQDSEDRIASTFNKPTEILEVNFKTNTKSSNPLTVTKLTKKTGYLPETQTNGNSYTVKIINSNGRIVSRTPFNLPEETHGAPPINDIDSYSNHTHYTPEEFVVTTGITNQAVKLQVLSPNGKVLYTTELKNVPYDLSRVESQSVNGSAFTTKGSQLNSLNDIDTTDSEKLDIAIIGDDYNSTQMNLFQSDAERVISSMLTYEPYKSRSEQIEFHLINNTNDLGCVNYDRLLVCNNATVTSRVNSANVAYDRIAVIVNNSEYGGAASTGNSCCAVTYNGAYAPEVFTHELAHLIGLLNDEYVSTSGYVDNQIWGNCYAGNPPVSEWNNLVGESDYKKGCSSSDWYRTSPGSLMYNLSYRYFNAISQKMINDNIDNHAGVYTDNVKPSIEITSPNHNSYVDGFTTIQSIASDNEGVARVTFHKDGELISTDYQAPYSFYWSPAFENPGPHSLKITAFDTAGNSAESTIIVLIGDPVVDEPEIDNTAPIITINSPLDGQTLPRRGRITVSVSVSDESQMKNTSIYINNKKVKGCGKKTECKFKMPINKFKRGQDNIFTVRAQDKYLNLSEESITIYRE